MCGKDVIQMRRSGHYIGTPNGMVLCVDSRDREMIEGRLYHGYEKEGIRFQSYEKVIRTSEELFNALGFPYAGNGDRDIYGRVHDYQKKELVRIMKDEELLEKRGDIGTFVVRVQHRQHSSWQGRVTYLEEDKTVYFRSALELVKIIDGTLDNAQDNCKE
jgi:hypothetical protein